MCSEGANGSGSGAEAESTGTEVSVGAVTVMRPKLQVEVSLKSSAGSRTPGARGPGRAVRERLRRGLLGRRRDVLVEPEQVAGVVLGLDGGEPVPGLLRVGGAHAVGALVGEEADVGAAAGPP